jgi:hypothetical protein
VVSYCCSLLPFISSSHSTPFPASPPSLFATYPSLSPAYDQSLVPPSVSTLCLPLASSHVLFSPNLPTLPCLTRILTRCILLQLCPWCRYSLSVLRNFDRFIGEVAGEGWQVMRDPVIAADGHVYERVAIQRCINSPNPIRCVRVLQLGAERARRLAQDGFYGWS